jgi:glutamate-1-semialdehyde 2,1-aminomutase
MSGITWEVKDCDREYFAEQLEQFVPSRVYDVHAHLWRVTDWQGNPPEPVRLAPAEITLEVYRQHMEWILPRREVHGMHFAYPATFPNDPAPCNEWVSSQVKKDPLARGQFYVRPADDPDWVESEVKRLGMRGLKPFPGFLGIPDISNAEIPEYFPEWMARLAHKEGWSVTLHIQRKRSIADESNLHWITTYCSKYPDMILILDHSARGFNPYHCIEGLVRLSKNLPENLYVDTSCNCASLATMACLKYLGADRVMYGSDFYISHLRGTNLPVGDSFLWLEQDMDIYDRVAYKSEPVLLGLENLRAVRAAFEILNLSDNDIENYFWGNAARALRIDGCA